MVRADMRERPMKKAKEKESNIENGKLLVPHDQIKAVLDAVIKAGCSFWGEGAGNGDLRLYFPESQRANLKRADIGWRNHQSKSSTSKQVTP